MTENAGAKQSGRFQPGRSGNPAGKPKGARNRATLAAATLLEGQAERLAQRAIDAAMSGDSVALRLCLERLIPVRRDRPISFSLPPIETAGDAARAMGSILTAVAAGEITPSEAEGVARLLDTHVRALEASDFEARLAALEAEKVR